MSGWRERVAEILAEPCSPPPWTRASPDPSSIATDSATSVDAFGRGFGGFGGSAAGLGSTAERLAYLATLPPAGVSPPAWRERLGAAGSFAQTWGHTAAALGWTDAELYSLHPTAPLMRLDAMGAAYLAAGKTVLAVTHDTVVLSVPPLGHVQRARRPTLNAPPAWEVFGRGELVQAISENSQED